MAFNGWDKIVIKTRDGKEIDGVAPIIISASRSTDIPAFYSEWFMKRIKEGYVKWTNPFNRQNQYISFKKTRVIVFWTKDAKPMIQYLPEIDKTGINYYFTFTLNDYENEKLEPSVPKPQERIATFRELSERIGKEKVIWRFDPLILSDTLTVENLLDKICKVGEQIHNYTRKLVISFADISVYDKVKRNLKAEGLADYKEFDNESMKRIAAGLQEMNKSWDLEIATCAEECDLSEFGIKRNRCIDDDLMIKLFNKDNILMDFLGYKQSERYLFSSLSDAKENELKDKGQRTACGCIVSKDIGQYNTCMHLCVYCYANYSRKTVEGNYTRYKQNGNDCESILCVDKDITKNH